jgi:fumarate reductase subunit D
MKRLLLRLEPVIWLLFGGGIMGGTILLTGWLLVVGVGVPLGIFPSDALAYGRVSVLGANPIGRALLALLVILPLWKGAHHLRHLSIDFNGEERDALVAPLLYAVAALGSALAIVAVLRL